MTRHHTLADARGRRYLAAAMPTARKRPVTKSGKPRARKGVKLKPTELLPPQLRVESVADELRELAGHDAESAGAGGPGRRGGRRGPGGVPGAARRKRAALRGPAGGQGGADQFPARR